MFNLTDVLNPNTADHDYSCFNRFYLADQITVIGMKKVINPLTAGVAYIGVFILY